MPAIAKAQIPNFIAVLETREVLLTHGCQLKDFKSYLTLGGVPSRASLANASLPYTPYQTDEIDRTNEVWDKVFFNLSDFGHWFAAGKRSLPNPYGPILLVFSPSVLYAASDISVTLRSAGANGFNREAEALTLDEIPQLFVDGAGVKRHIKFTQELREQFPSRKVEGNPEMSCTFPLGVAPIQHLRYIIVDHYTQAGLGLDEAVRQLLLTSGIYKRVIRRRGIPERLASYQILWNAIANGVETLDQLLRVKPLHQPTHDWAESVLQWDSDSFQFGRFSSYLRTGTVNEPFQ